MLRSKQQKKARKAVAAGKKPAKSRTIRTVEYEALAQFRYRLRKFLSFSEAAAQKVGLTAQHYQALLAIKGFSSSEPVSVGELAEILLIRHHTAVELVDRMTKLGLLNRMMDDADSRRVLVKLTRKGEARLQALAMTHLEELHSAGPALGKILLSFRRSRSR